MENSGRQSNSTDAGTNAGQPVFFSASAHRWRLFLGVVRTGFCLAVIVGGVAALTMMHSSEVKRPVLPVGNAVFRQVLEPKRIASLEHSANVAYERARPTMTNDADFDYARVITSTPVAARHVQSPIRAAFLPADDDAAWFSLLRHADQINLAFPAWLAVPEDGAAVQLEADARTLRFLRARRLPIVPTLADDPGGRAEDLNVRRILASAEERRQFIASIVEVLRRERFSGVNVFFPSLDREEHALLVSFLGELAAAAKPEKFLVVVTLPAFRLGRAVDLAAPIAALGGIADYVVLLAHDEHTFDTMPGAIAPPTEVAAVLDAALRQVPPEKLILSVASHGYNWPEEEEGRPVSYSEALENARESGAAVRFGGADSALHFGTKDELARRRQVFLADAASAFNTLRLAADRGLSGAALAKLGSEDGRVWEFFGRELSLEALRRQPVDSQRLQRPEAGADIDYLGEGDVMEVTARAAPGRIAVKLDAARQMIVAQDYLELPSAFVVRRWGKVPNKIVLTFDDGPDPRFTPRILDILEREQVPGTFFVVGLNAEMNLPLLRRMYAGGHEIGNHTFSHPNLSLVGTERLAVELQSTRRLIESVTGHSTILFRPPFNADSEPATVAELLPVLAAQEQRYLTIAESIDPRDWEPGIKAEQIIARLSEQPDGNSILLLHDAGGNRAETVKALPGIIRHYRAQGCTFTTVAGLLGLSRDEVMPPLRSTTDRWLVGFNWQVAALLAAGARLLAWLFIVATVLSIVRTLAVATLAIIQMRRRRREAVAGPLGAPASGPARRDCFPAELAGPEAGAPGTSCAGLEDGAPLVSVIVPAFNEEVTCEASVRRLLAGDWPAMEIIFVDDGSRDRTFEIIRAAFANEPRVRAFTKPNGGKASALNYGIERAAGDYLVCIDADTQLAPDAIGELMRAFADPRVVAVAGNVKIGNEVNLLTRWQAIEYITSQSFDRHAFDLLNGIMVVPGAIGAFRKDAVLRAGGFTTDTLAEDCELTVRLLRAGGVVRYQPSAIARTEAPETLRAFLKQRFRWCFGILQSVWKHRDAAFHPRFKGLGMAALPNAILFQFLLPAIAPIADLTMIVSLFAGFWRETLGYYVVFTLVDLLGGVLAFHFEKERMGRLWALIPQRFGYRQIMYFVLFRAFLAALRGRLVGWGVLSRTGHAQGVMEGGK